MWGSGKPGSDFLGFLIRSLLRNDQCGAPVGQAQVSFVSQLNPYSDMGSGWPGSNILRFLIESLLGTDQFGTLAGESRFPG